MYTGVTRLSISRSRVPEVGLPVTPPGRRRVGVRGFGSGRWDLEGGEVRGCSIRWAGFGASRFALAIGWRRGP